MYRILILFAVVLAFTACRKPQTYPEIPAITFQSFTKQVTTDLLGNKILRGRLSFYLIDGNGDIGLHDSDTTAPWSPGTEYFNNLHLSFYNVENGVNVEDTSKSTAYRTPYIEPKGQNKLRKCTIIIDIDYEYDTSHHLPFDSIMYTFYIYDRSLNMSNIETTGLIVLP